MKMKLETDQWKKTAKATASVFVGDVEICSKTAELEYLVLYYNNRADKRMSIGKMRKALDDSEWQLDLMLAFLRPP